MRRLLLLIPGLTLAAGTVFSLACTYHPPAGGPCDLQSGSATVSSPTGVFGPPDFDGVTRNYTVTARCPSLTPHDHRQNAVTTASGSFLPPLQFATEEIAGFGFQLVTTWTCNGDPWLTADVRCTNHRWEQREGQFPDGFTPDRTRPLSAQLLGVNDRRQIAADLIADFADKLKRFPNTCTGSATEFTSSITAPAAGAVFHPTGAVPLNVQRPAGCSAAIDGVDPRFELQWQVQDPATGQFRDIDIVPIFDGVAHPDGGSVAQSVFAPFKDPFAPATFRVRARLLRSPSAAPWPDFVQFILDPV